ncbi:hypothetical protein [Klenkia taihuensis]|uniref:Uncharacterized protein n=1 Tax=Klenkia taihuensis TaxID=1225127 RepID=A0A1I1MD17_9ACTN|nr:hypothetical protein [Klenkia taihuensis]GHE14206.1 hypothetical protein GCM10011381_39790 [Klenkia taihuensis]SFC83307.1 hypothetical protein SAMN05661030_1643 [Klenkia taihuensis]
MSAVRTLGWAVLAAAVAFWLAAVEVFWLPLRIGPVPVPLSVVGAVAGNLLLVAWAQRLSGSRLVAVVPVAVWLVVAVGASVRRPEGDLVITGETTAAQVVGLAFLLLGVLAGSFAVGRALSRPVRRPEPVPVDAGSGTGGAR